MAHDIMEEVQYATGGHAVDAAVGALAFAAISTAWMDWLDVFFKVIAGFLVIVLLLQRIYANHQRNKRLQKRDPLQQ